MLKLMKNKKCMIFIYILLFLLVPLSACTTFTVPPNHTQGYGELQIHSEPAGAAIFLNGSDTGYISPKLIKNVSADSHLVSLRLEGYLNSNHFVQVYPNKTVQLNVVLTPNPFINPPDPKYLIRIEVIPDETILLTGYSANISSIRAFYSDGSNQIISKHVCHFYSTEPNVVNVSYDGMISGISEGQAYVLVEYTENNITKSDTISVQVIDTNSQTGNLVNLSVLPSTMSLMIGESKTVSSITANYESGAEKIINPDQCSFSTDNSVVLVNNTGIITGNYVGNSIVTIAYTENNITRSDTIAVSVTDTIENTSNYRALAIGIGDYIYYGEDGDLIAPPYDINKVKELFYDCQFGSDNTVFSKVSELKDTQATKSNIIQKIQSTFNGANVNDVSYFYFSGHGATLNQTSYLCPADFDGDVSTAISVHELESILSNIPGTKVVFIDSCHSGGFIGKDILRNETSDSFISEEDYLSDFNDSIINTFTKYNISKDLLTSSEYQVLTSSHWYQSSYELNPQDEIPFGVFTQALYEGSSLNNNIPADSNMDNSISLNEAYNYIIQWVAAIRISQDVQVYPVNSNFPIFEY